MYPLGKNYMGGFPSSHPLGKNSGSMHIFVAALSLMVAISNQWTCIVASEVQGRQLSEHHTVLYTDCIVLLIQSCVQNQDCCGGSHEGQR